VTCSSCGARARADALWCGQCHASLAAAAPAAPASGRYVPPTSAVALPPTYSRWRKTDTSFGPVGRVGWTVAMVLVAAMAVFSQNPFAIGPLCFILVPVVLRSVWSRSRVS
jgi:hypothetical protein